MQRHVWCVDSPLGGVGVYSRQTGSGAKPESSICLLYKWADTAFWLCRAEQVAVNDVAGVALFQTRQGSPKKE